MSPDASPPTTDLPLLVGRYRLLDKLGEGGMGAVFRAQDTKLDRNVAVKLLPVGTAHDAGAVARFGREARALAHLAHPGIIQAHDSGQDNGRHFLVMELVEGRSLAKLLSDQGGLAPTRAADYVHQAALALDHAHRHGLVHRDVKPSNLLVTGEGRVKLLDLGLARFLQDQVGDGTLTREGTGLGTPDYAAPEQFRDAHKADARSDIYALGCTLYHLIGGRVPFPGSSLSEKVLAHERQEPPPLEELCPQMPVGLALVVRCMMAKRPADRFASMAEVAAALTPYVASSSASVQEIRKTTAWTAAQLVTMTSLPRRGWRARRAAAVAMAVLVVTGAVLGLGFAQGWFGPDDAELGASGKAARDPGALARPDAPVSPTRQRGNARADPNVLTVAQKPGAARFQTITAALEAVKPGQTIRVLDGEVYRERLSITRPSIHTGITLEAPGGAVFETTNPRSIVIEVGGVQGVTLRQLRLRATNSERCTLVVAGGKDYSGLRLEQLELAVEGTASDNNGIELLPSEPTGGPPAPVVVERCRFCGLNAGVILGAPLPNTVNAHMAVRDGVFTNCAIGVRIDGRASAIQVVGNRFWGARLSAMQLEFLPPENEGILLANNTCYECGTAFRLWDRAINGKDVRIRNNLVVGTQGRDFDFTEADDHINARGPGDGRAVALAYDFGHNWREGHEPTGENARAWVRPDPKKGDVFKDQIDGVNRDPKSPDFLRAEADSPLASDGAGTVDPTLPRYVGALPPEGAEPWDWDRAWRMPKNTPLLTVSRRPNDGGKYRTITAALRDARPWATVRVLDASIYREAINLNDRKKFEGLTLEAVPGATLHMTKGVSRLITIDDVPHVRVTGFTFTESGIVADQARAFVLVTGGASGVTLTRLEMRHSSTMFGILIQNGAALPGQPPLRVERCMIRPTCPLSNDGISVAGSLDNEPAGGLCLRSNRIFNSLRGINLHGHLRDVQVCGNLLVKCPGCGVQVEDLTPASRGILIANNTAFNGGAGFRAWEYHPYKGLVAGQVEIANNLFFGAANCDLGYVRDPGGDKDQGPGDVAALPKLWRFHHNRRDFSGALTPIILLASAEDGRFKRSELVAVDENNPDRVRPGKDSPLAVQGAGTEHGSLPAYIGALPREGEEPWDWDRTWRARVRKRPSPAK
jgi:hypothetical protein